MSHTTTELHEMIERLEREFRWLKEEFYFLRRVIHRILEIEHHYTILIGAPMAITVGQTGTFTATLEDNGIAISLPSGSTFAWKTDDASATLAPSEDTTSVVVTIPAGSTSTTITVTASTTAPDGSTVEGSVSVPVNPETHVYTVSVSQTS
jgi:hypothetical protein